MEEYLSSSAIPGNSTILANETNYDEDDTLGKLMRNIELGHRIFIIVFGSIGNCLSVIIFSSKQLRHLSSSFYLSALAVSDTGFLFVVFINWLQGVGFDLLLKDVYCRMQNYFSNVFGFLSVWFVVAFTVERFIAVKYPLMRPSMCTVSRAKAVIGGLCGISLILFIPSLATQWKILSQPETNSSICIPASISSLDAVMNTVDLVAVMAIPCVVIITMNTCICFTIRRLERRRRRMTLSGRGFLEQHLQPKSNHSQNKVTRLLLIVSSVFICLNLPSYVLRLIVFIPEFKPSTATHQFFVLQKVSYLLYYTNFGINFALYCVTGQNFRKSLLTLFFPTSLRQQDTTRNTVVSEVGRPSSSRRRTITLNGSLNETQEMIPLNNV